MILKKVDGITEKIEIFGHKEEKLNFHDIKCFNFLNLDNKSKEILCKRELSYILNDNYISNNEDYYMKYITMLYKKITRVKNIEQLKELYISFKNELSSTNVTSIKNHFNLIESEVKNIDVLLNEFCHAITNKYCKYLVKYESKDNIINLNKQLLKDPKIDTLELYKIKLSNNKQSNMHEVTNAHLSMCINTRYKSCYSKHLCFDCPIDICNCEKIMDDNKKTIEKYYFITDGMQVYGKDGELIHFYVTNCENYNNEKKKIKN